MFRTAKLVHDGQSRPVFVKPPTCEHGQWTFAGSDSKRGASKWRCPTAEYKPASVWIKVSRLHPLIPRKTPRYRKLYRGRSAVEREFGRLKHDCALATDAERNAEPDDPRQALYGARPLARRTGYPLEIKNRRK